MYMDEMNIFIQQFVDPSHDLMFVDMLRHDMAHSPYRNDFDAYADDLCRHSFQFHLVEKVNQHLVIKNLQECDTIIASICASDSPPIRPCGKRWTHNETRLVRRCFPYIQKWPHLLRVLKRRTWKEIEQKAKECHL
jgi:hypothetical protein